MSTQIEITGQFLTERFRFENVTGDVIIGDVKPVSDKDNSPEGRKALTIKGPAEIGELSQGMEYRFFGRWSKFTNKRTGKQESQFAFNSFCKVAPVSREAIIAYLTSHGAGKGIGKVRAAKIYEQLGKESVEVARTDPERIYKVLRAAGTYGCLDKLRGLARSLAESEATEAIKLDLISLLTGRGFPKQITSLVIKKWGNRAAQIIRRDPYRLMIFGGCGFKRCDSMYLDLGLNPTRLKRQTLCAWFSISRNGDGHTWFPQKVPAAFLKANISGAGIRELKALELGVRGKVLSTKCGAEDWFAEKQKADNEQIIADCILRSRDERPFWPKLGGLNLSAHQKAVTSECLQSTVCILGGSPGTGKTWTVSEIVKAIGDSIGMDNVLVGAPTGKAAVRVTENLQEKGIDLRARTWHSLLMQLELKGGQFKQKVLIGDESSMLDTDLMARIFKRRATGSMLLLVGDVHQLPPVGHGAPLRDMISAGVPYGELTEIIRNSGGIVEACAAMRDCQPWGEGDNLHIVNTQRGHLTEIKAVIESAKKQGLDPVWDVQLVTAVNEKSKLSRKELNAELQLMLNDRPGVRGVPFRVGDKVVNTKNGFFKSLNAVHDFDTEENERDEVYVANGELAEVTAVDAKSIICRLTSPERDVQVYFGQEGGCTFELGYALSVHKSQGSDWPWVIVVLDDYPGARMVCDRSWLYTAISRAKQHCVLIGPTSVAKQMCRHSKMGERKTFLKELILEGSAKEVLANV